jgi:hypothetical protein
VELSLGYAARWMAHHSVDPLSDSDQQSLVTLRGGYRLLELAPALELVAELEYEYGSISGQVFQRLDTATELHHLALGARLDRHLGRVRLSGRLSVGALSGALELRERGSAAPAIADHERAAFARAGAGAEVRLLSERLRTLGGTPFDLGVRFELGYLLAGKLSWQGMASRGDAGDGSIPVSGAPLGDVDLGGATLQLAIVARM